MQEFRLNAASTSMSSMPGISQKARAVLYFLLAFVVIFWTLIPILGHHTPPLDVIEMTTWAHVPQLGYYKHPPLPAWGIYVSELIFGRNSFALFIPSALSIAIAILAVWPLALRFFGAQRGIIALFFQSTLIYYNLYAPDYNHNVAQIPFWALTVSAFYFAVSDGRARYWIAFGAALGVTTLSKYSAAFLPLACVVLLLWEKQARRFLSVKNIILAAIAFFVVLGPHLLWLVLNDFAPIHYMNDRLGDLSSNASWSERFISYVAMQILVHLVLIGLGIWCIRTRRSTYDVDLERQDVSETSRLNQRFLWVMGFGPFTITVLLGLSGSYLHPMWATAMFPLSGLILVRLLGVRTDVFWSVRWLIAWIVLMSFFGVIYASKNTAGWHQITKKYARASYPGPELAKVLDQKWRLAFPDTPLRYIVGTSWEAGVASFESSFDTQVLIEGDLTISPWISERKLSNCGALVVWDPNVDMFTILKARWPQIREQDQLSILPVRAGTYTALRLSWAIIPPQGPCDKK